MNAPTFLRFSLVDHNGTAATESRATGAPSIFFFGFTHCRVVCPRALAKLSRALDDVGEADLHAFYVTVDPERDSPEVMHDYLTPRYPRFTGLTGTESHIRQLMASLHVYARRTRDSREPDGYAMPHSAFTYVFDSSAHYLTHLGDAVPAEEISAVLRGVVHSGRQNS